MVQQVTFNLPPELERQRRQAERKARLAEALASRGMEPVRSTASGRLAAPVSPFQGASQILSAYFGGRLGREEPEDQARLSELYHQGARSATDEYLRGIQGEPARGPIEGAASPSASVPADPERATAMAMTSPYPGLASMAREKWQEMVKERKERSADYLKLTWAEPNSMVAASLAARQGDPNAIALLKPKVGFEKSGPYVFTTEEMERAAREGREPQPVFYSGEIFGEPEMLRGPDRNLLVQREQRTREFRPIDKAAQTTIKMPEQERAAAKRSGELQAEMVADSAKEARSASKAVSTAHRALEAIDSSNAITGFLATPRNMLLRIGSTIGATGATDEERLANTSQLVQALAQSQVDASWQLKGQGQITEAERALLANTAGGDIGQSIPEIRRRLENIDNIARKFIALHNSLVDDFAKQEPNIRTNVWRITAPPPYNKAGAMGKYRVEPVPSDAPGSAKTPLKTPLQEYDQYEVK